MGGVEIELPNGAKCTKILLKGAIYASNMTFMLISVSCLNEVNGSTTFSSGMCTIKSATGCTIATILHADGLYHVIKAKESPIVDSANVTSVKWMISNVHCKLGHIVHSAIKYTITQRPHHWHPTRPKFCELCTKAKLAQQPFPKESETCTSEYRECVHWDLWGPATVRSLSGNLYMAAHIDDTYCETMLYFQVKKSHTIDSYNHDEVLIETQTSNRIKVSHLD